MKNLLLVLMLLPLINKAQISNRNGRCCTAQYTWVFPPKHDTIPYQLLQGVSIYSITPIFEIKGVV